jgi:glycosyltransferase involved in cell wall biosynthesis
VSVPESPATGIVRAASLIGVESVPAALRDGRPLAFPALPLRDTLGYRAIATATHAANRVRERRDRWQGRQAPVPADGGCSDLPELHQSTQTMRPWDAVSNDTLAIQELLRRNGFRSEIFAEHIDPALRDRVRSIDQLADPAFAHDDVLVHVCVHAPRVMRSLEAHPGRLHLRFHSNTPPAWFTGISYGFELSARRGWEEMTRLSGRCVSAIADSAHNEREIRSVGMEDVTLVPILLAPAEDPPAWRGGGGYAISVGRIAPNKRIDFLLRTIAAYQQLHDPEFGLVLVGSDRGLERYAAACHALERELGVRNVRWVGSIEEAEKLRLMAEADAYLCASDHEGFCVPIVESFRLGLPVVARATSAVTDTCGDALAVDTGDPALLANVLRVVATDESLRAALIATQNAEARRFDPALVGEQVLAWARLHSAAP